jgi:hypothetical protein
MTNCNLLILVIFLLALLLFYQISTANANTIQIGGQDIVSTNIIAEGADADLVEADIQAESLAATENVFMGDFRTADYTDANLSRSDINTIANGPSYDSYRSNSGDQANMYFTGDVVDGIGNFTVDGTNRVQGQPQPRRIDPNILPGVLGGRPGRRDIGRVIEANSWSMVDFRPRRNDSAFRIMRAGVRQLDVIQVFDFMGRTSFVLRLKGAMPTACNQLRILPVRLDPFNNIRLTVYSIVDPLLSCTKDIREWQVVIPLIQLGRGRYNIVLNNRPVTGLIQN